MRPDQPRPSRLAVAFVVVGLAFSATGIAYIVYAGRERSLPPITTPDQDPRVEQLEALLGMLTHSFLIFLAFLMGSYLMVRVGRHLLDQSRRRKPTEYVDAWGNYRLTQDEIDTATARLDDDTPPAPPPHDGSPQEPDERS